MSLVEELRRLEQGYYERAYRRRIPLEYSRILALKAGLHLQTLSPEPTPGSLYDGQECYSSLGVLVTGTGVIKPVKEADSGWINTGAGGAWMDITGASYTVAAGVDFCIAIADFKGPVDPGDEGVDAAQVLLNGTPQDVEAVPAGISNCPEYHALAEAIITVTTNDVVKCQAKQFEGHARGLIYSLTFGAP